jgi:hypothetical protein
MPFCIATSSGVGFAKWQVTVYKYIVAEMSSRHRHAAGMAVLAMAVALHDRHGNLAV